MMSKAIQNRIDMKRQAIVKVTSELEKCQTSTTILLAEKTAAIESGDIDQAIGLARQLSDIQIRTAILQETVDQARAVPAITIDIAKKEWTEVKRPILEKIAQCTADADKAFGAFVKAIDKLADANSMARDEAQEWDQLARTECKDTEVWESFGYGFALKEKYVLFQEYQNQYRANNQNQSYIR